MSHITNIEPMFFDERAVIAAAEEMTAEIVRGDMTIFRKSVQNGFGVQLPGWRWPMAIDTKTGTAVYDNYEGKWGNVAELNRFKQLYATHKLTNEARRRGYTVQRTVNSETNKITLQLGVA